MMNNQIGFPQSSQAHSGADVEILDESSAVSSPMKQHEHEDEENAGDGKPDLQNASSPNADASMYRDRPSGQADEDEDEDEDEIVAAHPLSSTADRNGEVSNLTEFDWADLNQRFQQKMDESHREEQKILQEFQGLTQYYNIWAQAGAHQEQDRASKRLRTRIAYVQNHEMQYVEKRNHHENVVQAFQNALKLLRGS